MAVVTPDIRLHVTADAHVQLLSRDGRRELSLAETFSVGWSLARRGQHTAAKRVFAALARQYPADTQIFIMLAESHISLGEEKAASEALRRVFGAAEMDTVLRLQAVLVSWRRGAVKVAVAGLGRLVDKHPELPLFHLLLARLYAQASQPWQAGKHWREAVAADRADGYVSFVAHRCLAQVRGPSAAHSGDAEQFGE